MAKKLLIKTPQTTDGKTLRYDGENQVVYSKSIVELGARKNFESINAKLPKHLQHQIEEIEVADDTAAVSTNEELQRKLRQLELERENEGLAARVEELHAGGENAVLKSQLNRLELENENEQLRRRIAELETRQSSNPVNEGKKSAEDLIADIQAAESVEAVAELTAGETRKTVLDAAKKRVDALSK